MSATFIDTSFLLALALESDALHERARAWQKSVKGPFLTTDFILLEIGNALSRPSDHSLALSIIDDLERSSVVEIVPASRSLVESGRELYAARTDKEWGLKIVFHFS